MLNVVSLIVRKRDGHALTRDEVHALVDAYTAGTVPDYQMAAFLMAALLRGLDGDETAALADAMLHSGEVLRFDDVAGPLVDKHSTGGVGDKTSLILAPVVAALGVPVPMISGRGLGHTGGTLDKLESIPGFRTDLTVEQYRDHVRRLGLALIGQTDEIAPADRKLYALRDVTGTVEFIPFIAASIMSKKLAEGATALVLDVKTGRGAFMQREDESRALAEALVGIGLRAGVPTVALLTRMDDTLGCAVGNWPEVHESLRCLRGDFAGAEDLMAVTRALGAEMLVLGGKARDAAEGAALFDAAIHDGRAWDKFAEVTAAQGGDPSALDDLEARDGYTPAAEVRAPEGAGPYLTGFDSRALGLLAVDMGAGRRTKEDAVDPVAGFWLHKRPGDAVQPGERLATFYTRRTDRLAEFEAAFLAAATFGAAPPEAPPLVVARYDGDAWTPYEPDAR
jgi:pyrimidine-nucleoside phosphorylase